MTDPIRTILHDPVCTPSIADAAESTGGTTPTNSGPIPNSGARYVLGEEIARGGMGVVYRVTDTVFDRQVAVKVLQDRFAPSSGIARRFFDEARITGQLQHPAIPPAHDIGLLPDGRPFLAMKLIEGKTFADLLTRPERERLELIGIFEQICQAVAFAHTHGVIHRDLKPANVMVGAFGEVQVMDWGLAKELASRGHERPKYADPAAVQASRSPEATTDHHVNDESIGDRTHDGQAIGTPAYMSPEQARGDVENVDRRSDVFALGGILCTILTGKPPYTGATSAEVMKKAMAGDLANAFARIDVCGADAELIGLCRSCLSADLVHRPADAGAVAALVGTHRAAAEARLRTAERQRAAAEAKAVEQRKKRLVQLMLAGTVGLLVVSAAAFGWWQNIQAEKQRSADLLRQLDNERREAVQKLEDERRANEERGRLGRNSDALAALVRRCEVTLSADDADWGAAAAALTEIERRFPEGGGDAFAERIAQCRTDVALLFELDAIDQLHWTPIGNELPEPFVLSFRWHLALKHSGLELSSSPASELAQRVQRSHLRNRLLTTLEFLLLAERTESVRAVLRTADPDPYREAVRVAIAARNGKRVAELALLPEALTQPPRFAVALCEHSAVPAARRIEILRVALGPRPGSLPLLMALGNTYPLDRTQGVYERVRWFQAAVAAHPRNSAAHSNLAVALLLTGDVDGAIVASREAVRLGPQFAHAHNTLGVALATNNKLDEAVVAFRESIRLEPDRSDAHNNLGLALAKKNDLKGAITAYKEAIRLNPKIAPTHNDLGFALAMKNELDGAVAAYREAIRLDPNLAPAHYNLGHALALKNDPIGAIAAYKQAIRLDPSNAGVHNNLGLALVAADDPNGAITAYRDAIRLDPNLAPAHYNLGRALRANNDLDGAIAAFKAAIRIDPNYVDAFNNLGTALRAKNDVDGAIAALREAIRLDPNFSPAHNNLGNALRAKNDPDGAIAAYKRAIELDPKYASAHINLGLILQFKGDFTGAIAAFENALRLDPKNQAFKNHLDLARKLMADRDAKIAPLPREVKH